jgi:hypothetical protein
VAFARYASEGSPLLSGYLLGEEYLQGYAAGLDVHHGQGRVILLGMRPNWRGQPMNNFKILFNSLLFTQAAADAATPTPDFWTPPADSEVEAESVGDGPTSAGRWGGR